MIKLLKYYAKTRWHIVAIISFILLAITAIYMSNSNFIKERWIGENQYIKVAFNSPFTYIAVIGSILATIIPIFEFNFKMNKVGIDQMYSLPIKREKLYLTKYIVGLIEVVIPITVTTITSLVVVLCSEHMFKLIYFIPYYFVLLGLLCLIYSTICFVYTRANTIIDGLILIVAYIIILVPVSSIIYSFINGSDSIFLFDNDSSYYFVYSPITVLTGLFNTLICENNIYDYPIDTRVIVSLVIVLGLQLVSIILFTLLNKKEPAENSTGICASLFGYKTIIPIYLITLLGMSQEIIVIVIIIIAGYLACVVYLRSFKTKNKIYLVAVTAVVLGLILHACIELIN